MASKSLGVVFGRTSKLLFKGLKSPQNNAVLKRQITSNESGGVLDKPDQVSFGVVKLVAVVVPFTYIGAMISQKFATWLEEHELFVPDDDDDD